MMDIIVCAGANLFRMYVTYRFIRIFLEETKLIVDVKRFNKAILTGKSLNRAIIVL